jgi:hypothetical protein
MTTVTAIEFVDHGVQGEYGMFGKRVAKLDTIGMTEEMIAMEIEAMKAILGDHVAVIEIEEINYA